jgi:putative flippase GtrA|tara:strand:- start:489 stop:866 length:378 start_codon:yes stop_codon:yes gene_type:complete
MSYISQIIKYGSVGFVTNALGYMVYIVIANIIGVSPPVAAIISGFLVISLSFYLNKRFSFGNNSKSISMAVNYYILYVSAILFHSFIIFIFSNVLGFAHEIIAGISIILISCSLFLIQKFLLFKR